MLSNCHNNNDGCTNCSFANSNCETGEYYQPRNCKDAADGCTTCSLANANCAAGEFYDPDSCSDTNSGCTTCSLRNAKCSISPSKGRCDPTTPTERGGGCPHSGGVADPRARRGVWRDPCRVRATAAPRARAAGPRFRRGGPRACKLPAGAAALRHGAMGGLPWKSRSLATQELREEAPDQLS